MTSAGVSWLFVPGSRPERFTKAVAAGPSQVIVDLEDAVAIADKESARGHTARWLSDGGTAWVRINADGTPWHLDDLSALEGCRGLRGVVVPKSEQPDALSRIADRLPAGAGVIALVESALGIQVAATIAAARGVDRLAFGSIDFALDIDAAETDEALLLARSALVLASRAAVLPPPIDGVTVETRDTDVVRLAALRARSLGFGGKLCIHPAQVPIVDEAFAPTSADLEWARRVLQAAGQGEAPNGVATMDGAMVDKPVLERALRIVSRGGG